MNKREHCFLLLFSFFIVKKVENKNLIFEYMCYFKVCVDFIMAYYISCTAKERFEMNAINYTPNMATHFFEKRPCK
jgi:hypothetical protein